MDEHRKYAADLLGLTVCERCGVQAVQWVGPWGLCGRCDQEHSKFSQCDCHRDDEGYWVPCGEHI